MSSTWPGVIASRSSTCIATPQLMSSYDVVAAPTLIKEAPLPKRMLVGDLSDTARVLAALDISPPAPASAATPG